MKYKFVCFLLFCVSSLSLVSCDKDSTPTGPSTPLPGSTGNGYISVKEPSYYDSVGVGTSVNISWRTFAIDTLTPVAIQLFREDTLISTITSYTANDGSYSWAVGSFPSGNKYHIKIVSTTDTSEYDFGAYFRIFSIYHGSLAVLTPRTGDSTTIGSQLAINWSVAGSIGSYIGIRLYRDSTFVYTIRSSQYIGGSSVYTWSSVQTSLGSGDRYRIMI